MAQSNSTKYNSTNRKSSSEFLRSVTPSNVTRYNLRSHGPPSYEIFADQECPICLEDYNAPVIVNCGHSFCQACITQCIVNGSFEICPVCKKRLVQTLFISCKDFTNRILKKRESGNFE